LLPLSDRRAQRYSDHGYQVGLLAQFGHIFRDWSNYGRRTCLSDLVPAVAEWERNLARPLARRSARRYVALATADRLRTIGDYYLTGIAEKLEDARHHAVVRMRLSDGKVLLHWDQKACYPRLDPDDAREDAARFSRRAIPKLLELASAGASLHYAVFTLPNFVPGELRVGMKKISKRFARLVRRCKAGEIKGCEGVIGALSVLEAPASASHDWNVHLNVVLVNKGPWLDYRALRAAWHWNVEVRRIPPELDKVEAALREIVKYSVQTVASKSQAKADAGPMPKFPSGCMRSVNSAGPAPTARSTGCQRPNLSTPLNSLTSGRSPGIAAAATWRTFLFLTRYRVIS